MKRFLQSYLGLLGFHWASLAILNSADNLWCEFTWCPGEKWAQCRVRKFPTSYYPDRHEHILSQWIARSLGELPQGIRPNHFTFRSTWVFKKIILLQLDIVNANECLSASLRVSKTWATWKHSKTTFIPVEEILELPGWNKLWIPCRAPRHLSEQCLGHFRWKKTPSTLHTHQIFCPNIYGAFTSEGGPLFTS